MSIFQIQPGEIIKPSSKRLDLNTLSTLILMKKPKDSTSMAWSKHSLKLKKDPSFYSMYVLTTPLVLTPQLTNGSNLLNFSNNKDSSLISIQPIKDSLVVISRETPRLLEYSWSTDFK